MSWIPAPWKMGGYRITVAASPTAGGRTINLAGMNIDQYMRNPVVMYNHGRDIVLDKNGIKEIRIPNDATAHRT